MSYLYFFLCCFFTLSAQPLLAQRSHDDFANNRSEESPLDFYDTAIQHVNYSEQYREQNLVPMSSFDKFIDLFQGRLFQVLSCLSAFVFFTGLCPLIGYWCIQFLNPTYATDMFDAIKKEGFDLCAKMWNMTLAEKWGLKNYFSKNKKSSFYVFAFFASLGFLFALLILGANELKEEDERLECSDPYLITFYLVSLGFVLGYRYLPIKNFLTSRVLRIRTTFGTWHLLVAGLREIFKVFDTIVGTILLGFGDDILQYLITVPYLDKIYNFCVGWFVNLVIIGLLKVVVQNPIGYIATTLFLSIPYIVYIYDKDEDRGFISKLSMWFSDLFVRTQSILLFR